MIGFLRGKIVTADGQSLILDVNGVGYRVLVSSGTLLGLNTDENLELFTHTHVRDDALDLYGFQDRAELKLFENLLTVSGVGPRSAMGIFSIGKRDEIVQAIIRGDVDFFTKVPRLGRKNAQKIIIELKNKFGSTEELDLSEKDRKENNDIITALKSFGFSPSEIKEALKNISKEASTTEERIRFALKELGR